MEQDIPEGSGIDEAIAPRLEDARAIVDAPRPCGSDGRLDAETRRRIGRSLRTLYAGLLDQPIPDRFQALIAELAVRSGEGSQR